MNHDRAAEANALGVRDPYAGGQRAHVSARHLNRGAFESQRHLPGEQPDGRMSGTSRLYAESTSSRSLRGRRSTGATSARAMASPRPAGLSGIVEDYRPRRRKSGPEGTGRLTASTLRTFGCEPWDQYAEDAPRYASTMSVSYGLGPGVRPTSARRRLRATERDSWTGLPTSAGVRHAANTCSHDGSHGAGESAAETGTVWLGTRWSRPRAASAPIAERIPKPIDPRILRWHGNPPARSASERRGIAAAAASSVAAASPLTRHTVSTTTPRSSARRKHKIGTGPVPEAAPEQNDAKFGNLSTSASSRSAVPQHALTRAATESGIRHRLPSAFHAAIACAAEGATTTSTGTRSTVPVQVDDVSWVTSPWAHAARQALALQVRARSAPMQRAPQSKKAPNTKLVPSLSLDFLQPDSMARIQARAKTPVRASG